MLKVKKKLLAELWHSWTKSMNDKTNPVVRLFKRRMVCLQHYATGKVRLAQKKNRPHYSGKQGSDCRKRGGTRIVSFKRRMERDSLAKCFTKLERKHSVIQCCGANRELFPSAKKSDLNRKRWKGVKEMNNVVSLYRLMKPVLKAHFPNETTRCHVRS
ncbi:unnamed protein product [Cercopithifilaria johnstoni]|uniref:Uncharacterized protein n=1 Tax=Cercopithifilaria johnstoni TaxID=2874296 RepID=A0A8J2MEH6_9BILA|nr:unnamed protein product [Cercopithifilaria johnstoni]